MLHLLVADVGTGTDADGCTLTAANMKQSMSLAGGAYNGAYCNPL